MRRWCFLIVVLTVGCQPAGPELGLVSGRVTLDGQPLEGARLMFQPDGNKPPSVGVTDKDGHYDAFYKRDVDGALVGNHTVRIRIADKPVIPAKYNDNSELQREVKAGKNEIDFELTSK
jgi:hypothetical protein